MVDLSFLDRLLDSPKAKWVAVAAGTLFIVIFVAAAIAPKNSRTLRFPTTSNSSVYYLSVAETPSVQQKGLGGTDSLPSDRGMLFVYKDQAERCFWMKDMRFALDIIWLGDDKRITYIENNLLPSSYPKNYCHTAKYVIELNAGQTSRLKQHQSLSF